LKKCALLSLKTGFTITDEQITHEGFFYIALVVRYTGNTHCMSDEEAYLGTHLSEKNPLYVRYLNFEVERLSAILTQHPHAALAKKRLQWVTDKLNGQG
jgi:tRNA A22 N-methylase